MSYRTRIAPSPTGEFHVGSARTAYFNWLAAKATGGSFLLRVDDTDEARNTPENVQVIFDSMAWLGLDHDLVMYQSKQTATYYKNVQILMAAGFAEVAPTGEVRLTLHKTYTKHFKLPTSWTDSIAGEVPITEADLKIIDGMVLCRADGSFLYNFCSVVDDLEKYINYVIRGVDHMSNTSKQEVLRQMLLDAHRCANLSYGYEPVLKYTHLGLMTLNKKKISKREPSHAPFASISSYIEQDIIPDAMLNYLLRMGWGPKQDDKTTTIITKERALELFLDGGSMKNSPAELDPAKLSAYNRKYAAMYGFNKGHETVAK